MANDKYLYGYSSWEAFYDREDPSGYSITTEIVYGDMCHTLFIAMVHEVCLSSRTPLEGRLQCIGRTEKYTPSR